MKLYNLDLLTYPHVPQEAPRTPVPSTYFDPNKGVANYKEHLDEMAYCEELSLIRGVQRAPLHAHGTMPSPNPIAAALSQLRSGSIGAPASSSAITRCVWRKNTP